MAARPVLVVLLLVATATSASAGPRLGVEGGLLLSELTRKAGPLAEPVPPTEHEVGWSLGAVVEQRLAESLALVSGLRYLQVPEDFEIRFMSPSGPLEEVTADFRNTFQSIEVPVRLEWRPVARGAFGGAVIEGGVAAAYLLEAWQTADLSSPSGAANSTFRDQETGVYERWSFSGALGAGWDVGLGAGVGTLRLRYAHGLTDWIESGDLDRYTRAWELEIGWRR